MATSFNQLHKEQIAQARVQQFYDKQKLLIDQKSNRHEVVVLLKQVSVLV